MKYLYKNNEKQMEITELKSFNLRTEHENTGYFYGLGGITYNVIEVKGVTFTIIKDGSGYYKWCLYSEGVLVGEYGRKSDILNELNK